jgi:homoserine O-acetyltransferase
MHNDLGDQPRFGGDFEAALGSFQARTVILNAETDRYIPSVDSEYEAKQIDGAQARPIPTI